MPSHTQNNQLLARLTEREADKIVQQCDEVELEFGTILCEPGQPYREVYFPLVAFISLVEVIDGHPPLEMGLIGSEGMLGATLVLEINDIPLRAVVQGPGSALKMAAPKFRRILRDSPALIRILQHYLYVLMAQLSQTAACTHFHEVETRLARWLLMTHDRAHGNNFHLTHQYLADMLGVQRSAVTIAAGALQQRAGFAGNHFERDSGTMAEVQRRGCRAELLANLGYEVSGSDAKRSDITRRLEGLGVRVAEGHDAANIGNADVVVTSSAIAPAATSSAKHSA